MEATNQLPLKITTKNIANIIVKQQVSANDIYSFSDGLVKDRTRRGDRTYFGFKDEKLNLVIPFKYKHASDFKNGLAIVQKEDDNYTIIDKTENEVLHGSYPVIFDFDKDTIIALRKTGDCTKEVVINFEEKTIYECNPSSFYDPGSFYNNRIFKIGNHGFVVKAHPKEANGRDIFINRQGEVIPTDKYTKIDESLFSPYGIVVGNDQNLFGAIDYQGREIVPCKFAGVQLPKEPFEKNPLAVVRIKKEIPWNPFGNNHYGYFNMETGKMEINSRFEEARPFCENLAVVVTKFGGKKYIDPTGKTVFDGLKKATDFKDGLAIVEIPGKSGSSHEKEYVLYNHSGPISHSYTAMRPFQEGYSVVIEKGTDYYGFIDQMGDMVFSCHCQNLTDFVNGMAFAEINNQYFKIDHSFQMEKLPNFNYNHSASFLTGSLIVLTSVISDYALSRIYDLSTKKLVTEKVRKQIPFQQQSDLEGKQVVSCQYLLTVRMGETKRTYVFATIEKRQEFLARLSAGQISIETPLPKVLTKRK